jgi:hypothetical protein
MGGIAIGSQARTAFAFVASSKGETGSSSFSIATEAPSSFAASGSYRHGWRIRMEMSEIE